MILKRFPRTFWVANTMELFERLAWYGMFMVLALYLTGSQDTGALGFTQEQKGYLLGTVVGLLYFMPVITGAIADKYGYKKVLIISYLILTSGYLLMGSVQSYTLVWLTFIYLAVGAALFKPVISATISKTTNEKTASIGFGIFYMIVNVGAFIGPVIASKLREHISWYAVFVMAATAILINVLLVIFFFKEPEIERKKDPLFKSVREIFINVWSALRDVRLLLFLLIIIGFWTMYNQLFFTLPVFIEQWVNTRIIYDTIAGISENFARMVGTSEGTINPELIANVDALYIVIFQVLVSTLVMKFRPLSTMITGILIASVGIGLWFITQNGLYLFISIMIFAFGEMAASPKILEYIGKIAPKDKVALYMGCYFLPMSGGNFLAGILSGNVYGSMSDKYTLLNKELVKRKIELPEIAADFTKSDFFEMAATKMGMSEQQLTQYLWTNYDPSQIWVVFSGVGFLTVILLWLYDRFLMKGSNDL